MRSEVKCLLGGVVLGSLITLIGAFLVGAEVTVNSLNNNEGHGVGQYQIALIPTSGSPALALLDTRTGEVVRIEADGTRSVVNSTAAKRDENRRIQDEIVN
jgi:hypothetical protein